MTNVYTRKVVHNNEMVALLTRRTNNYHFPFTLDYSDGRVRNYVLNYETVVRVLNEEFPGLVYVDPTVGTCGETYE